MAFYDQDAEWLDITLDYETFYDSKTYTLRKMDPPSYILDPRFECIGCAIKLGTNPTVWVDGPDVLAYLARIKAWAAARRRPIRAISHNCLFDMCIAAWHHGFVPDQIVDTLALSRALLGHVLRRHDLGSVARYLQLGVKGGTIVKVDGMRRADIVRAGLWKEYSNYSIQDADLARGIFDTLFPRLPWNEAVIFDMVHRMAVEPRLELDVGILNVHLAEVQAEKQALLAAAGLDFSTEQAKEQSIAQLMSNDRMAELLTGMGVTPPTKKSPSDESKTIYAFAKTDREFTDLLEHPDVAVQAIVAARLGHKSTLEESRCERMINVATVFERHCGVPYAPIALKPSGAHTHRLSGDWGTNYQNMPRPSLRRPVPKLRKAIRARKGRRIVAADSRQIEARLVATFCGQDDFVEEFASGADSYSLMATKLFGRPVTKADVGPRFCGKLLVLSGNYQTGWRKFRHTAAHNSKEQTGTMILLSEGEAQNFVATYRADKHKITGMWGYLQNVVIPAMTREDTDFMVGPVRVLFEKIELPNGMHLHYHQLHIDPVTGEWIFIYGGRTKKLYGGKLLENIIQALARIIVMDAAVTLREPMAAIDAHFVLQAHDELVYDAPEEMASHARALLEWAMRLRPDWSPAVPVDCESGVGGDYASIKN